MRRASWEFAQERELERARRAGLSQQDASVAEASQVAVLRLELEQALAKARREANTIVSEAEQKATEIVAAAERDRDALIAQARESAGRTAAEITRDAKRTASAIVKEAERRGDEIITRAEVAWAELERDLANERRLADQKREELSSMLVNLLGEVQRNLEDGTTNVLHLREARESRSTRADTAD